MGGMAGIADRGYCSNMTIQYFISIFTKKRQENNPIVDISLIVLVVVVVMAGHVMPCLTTVKHITAAGRHSFSHILRQIMEY